MIELKQKLLTPLGPARIAWIVEQAGVETLIGLVLEHDNNRVYEVGESRLLDSHVTGDLSVT